MATKLLLSFWFLFLLTSCAAHVPKRDSIGCHEDNCLRALENKQYANLAYEYCKDLLAISVPPASTSGIPAFLANCGPTSIISAVSSACPCFMATFTPSTISTISSPPATSASPSLPTQGCHQDNCLRALENQDYILSAYTFCNSFLGTIVPAASTAGIPAYLANCGPTTTVSALSSACPCFLATYAPTTSSTSILSSTLSPTSTATSPSSSSSLIGSSTTTLPSTTSSPSGSLSSTVSSSTPTCTPAFELVGVSENDFNPQLVPFSIDLTCTLLDVNNYTILLSGGNDPVYAVGLPLMGTTNTSTSISMPGFGAGYVNIAIIAMDTSGNAIIQSFQLLFGYISMPVLVLDKSGSPVSGVSVEADATVYPGISQVGTTDANGMVTFTNLALTTIGLTARTADNQIGVNGIAATAVTVPIQLMPFGVASNTTSFDISNGTTGWTSGVNEQLPVSKRDTVLSVSTNGQYTIQTASSFPKVYPFTKTVYIKYKFQTDEVPGGYFGTEYNDYYVITIRSNTGGYTAVTHSMNELGIGAFDADGNTDWYTLLLTTPVNTQWVEFDVGVSNVVDNLLDSQIIVDKIGDLTCETCGDCDTCPGNPLCQDICQNPPLQSCAYYISCSEAFLECAPSDYPIAYGEKNCLKFQNNLSIFSAAGQSFLWATMHCLQLALVASTTCDSTCDSLTAAAFASHPQCYVQSGFCSLHILDKLKVILIVGKDIFSGPAIQQALLTAEGCGQQLLTDAETEIEYLLSQAISDIAHAAEYLAQAAAVKILKAFFQNFLSGVPQV